MALGLMARTLDLEMLQSVSFCRWDLGVSGGLRWARLEDELSILGPAGQLALVAISRESANGCCDRSATCRPARHRLGGWRSYVVGVW